jgi:hypothetical protein
MARAISVKIPTATVIEMIENKVAEYKEQIENYPTLLANYKTEYKAWVKQVSDKVADVIANGHNLFDGDYEDTVGVNRSYRNGIEIRVGKNLIGDLADSEPTRPVDVDGWQGVKTKVKDLEKTLAVLRLTPQETVTSSTYNSVLELL